MKHAILAMTLLLGACKGLGADPRFTDIQRRPPDIRPDLALTIVEKQRALAEWIAETRKKCEEFGCVK